MFYMIRRTGLAVLLGASLLLGASAVAHAQPDGRVRCERRIRRAEANLDGAIRRHGEHSPQAERRRRELAEVRAHCQGL